MNYLYTKDGSSVTKYPINIVSVRKQYPNISFPSSWNLSDFAQYGVFPVSPTQKPTGDVVQETAPIFNGNNWEQAWEVRSYTPEEQSAADARLEDRQILNAVSRDTSVRNLLLASPEQINNYIDANVTDLASVKNSIGVLARTVSALARGLLRDN